MNYAWQWDGYASCQQAYHPRCYRLLPSRWPSILEATNTYKDRGLTARADEGLTRRFICEVCTVRAQTGADIGDSNRRYLELERARLITTWNAQSDGGVRALAGQRRKLMEMDALLPVGCPKSLAKKFLPSWPEPSSLRTLSWHLLALSRTGGLGENGARAISSVKKFRSAYFNELRDLRIDDESLIAFEKRHICAPGSIPTESIGFAQFFKGLRVRHGEQTQQAWPMPRAIACAAELEFIKQAAAAKSPWARYLTALARLAHDMYFTFMLRGEEPFMVQLAVVEGNLFLDTPCPYCREHHLAFVLQEHTKANMTGQQFDLLSVPLTGAGLRMGDAARAVLKMRREVRCDSPLLFIQENGKRWTGDYFRKTHLEPVLRRLSTQGHWAMKNAPWDKAARGMNIKMYRRGGDTFYQTTGIGGDLIDLMGRWKVEKRKNMPREQRQRYSGFSCKHMVEITSAKPVGIFSAEREAQGR